MTTPHIALIAAMDLDRCIGVNNTLPWHISADLKRFKALTTGKPIIMGRKTFDSLGGRPLPNRLNIVVSHNPRDDADNLMWVSSLESAIAQAVMDDPNEIMVIGGAQIYALALPLAHRLYLTEVDTRVQGDAFFPDIAGWQAVETEGPFTDEKSGLVYSYKTYER